MKILNKIEETLKFISEERFTKGKDPFLKSMAKFLGELFAVRYVLINKYSIEKPEITETVIIYHNGDFIPNITYNLKDTPCDNVIDHQLCSYPKKIRELFPKDDLLTQMGVESYIGLPLWSSKNVPIGLIAMLDDKQLKETKSIEIILQIVAVKVAQKLEKELYENKLKLQIKDLKLSKEILRESEKKLKKSEFKLNEAQKIAKIGHWDLDIVTGKIEWSNEISELFGTDPTKFKSYQDALLKIIHPDDLEFVNKAYTESLENKTNYNIIHRIILPNGKIRYLRDRCKTTYNKAGNPLHSFGTIQDITEMKVTQEDLTKSEQRFALAMQGANDGLFDWNVVDNSVYFSPRWKEILGYKDDEIENDFVNWEKLLHKDDSNSARKIVSDFLNSNETSYESEFRMKHKEGSYRHILARGIGVRSESGDLIRIVGTHVDITELTLAKKNAEESNRLKTEFLNNMSHEIRTPLNGILGFSQFLSDPNLEENKREYYIKIIQNSGNQLLRIIDDIIEISKLETKQVKAIETEVCLNDLLLDLFSIFDVKAKENKTQLYLKKTLSDKRSRILTDPSKLNIIISNLLDNALKFTNQGIISFGYEIKYKKIEIFVKDTGIGIKKEKQKIIFERFSQAEKELSKKVGGLGLGLSIAKENAKLLGGKIKVESEIMDGATFRVTIPYKPVYANDKIERRKDDIKKIYTILIVEDEEVNFMFIEILLLEQLKIPCKVLHAVNGLEAVELCKSNAKIDLILMDLKMPVMNGYEATKLIREFLPDVPIIAQTAYSTREEKTKALNVGCDHFLSKPIGKEELSNAIKSHSILKW